MSDEKQGSFANDPQPENYDGTPWKPDSMNSSLDGATEAPLPHVQIGTPGEFAAVWNSLAEESRAQWVAQIQGNQATAYQCLFIEEHRRQIIHLEARLKHALNHISKLEAKGGER